MEFYKCGYSCVFFSLKTKLYETQASELSNVALLHDYSFFIITYINNVTIACYLKRKNMFLNFTKRILIEGTE